MQISIFLGIKNRLFIYYLDQIRLLQDQFILFYIHQKFFSVDLSLNSYFSLYSMVL
jgi:hypothetical protein